MDLGIVVAIAAPVAAVWVAVVFLRGGLLAGCLAVLATGICFGPSLWSLPTGAVPITADRVLWLVLLMQYAVWRRLGRAEPKSLGTSEYVLLALVGTLLASAVAHDWQANNALPASRLLFFYLMPIGIYWVARQSVVSERAVRAMFGGLAVFGVYLAVTGIAETREAWWMVFPPYIATSDYTEFLGRARGPLLNPVGNGLLLTACLAGTLMCWPRAGRMGKTAIVAAAATICAGLAVTLTRSVWIGAVLGVLMILALVMPRRWLPAAAVGLLLAILLALTAPWEELAAFKRDRDVSAEAVAESARLRPILANVAWKMFCDRPVLGCGLGRYQAESGQYLSDRSGDLPLEKARPYVQHNVFLSLLTETGALGAGLFAALLMLWIRDAWRLWRHGRSPLWARQCGLVFLVLAVSYVTNGMFHDMSIIQMVHMVLFMAAGLVSGLLAHAEAEPLAVPSPAAVRLATAY